MVETTPVTEVQRSRRATAGWRLLLGVLGCSVGSLAVAAGEVSLSATMTVCVADDCLGPIRKEPDPGPGAVIAPNDFLYRMLGTRVRPINPAPNRFGVEFDVCVSNESPNRSVTQVLVAASVQPDAGVAPQLRSYLVKLAQPLKPGEAGCARGSITTPFRRPLVFVAHPAN